MKKTIRKIKYYHVVLTIVIICILLPIALITIWSFTGRWPWPAMLPESYSLRTLKELFNGVHPLPALLGGRILLASVSSLISTAVGVMTARALELYEFKGKSLIRFGYMLPVIVPATVLTMGLQIVFLKMGIADTAAGVIIIHVMVSMPYCTTIMSDVIRACGIKYEEQASVLGAGPLKAFTEVSLPLITPGILSSLSMGFILSYSQYFTTLIIGGGRVNTLSLVLVPYIQSGDRPLMSIYSLVFVISALIIFFILEQLLKLSRKETA